MSAGRSSNEDPVSASLSWEQGRHGMSVAGRIRTTVLVMPQYGGYRDR
jgi:hypothetical protein